MNESRKSPAVNECSIAMRRCPLVSATTSARSTAEDGAGIPPARAGTTAARRSGAAPPAGPGRGAAPSGSRLHPADPTLRSSRIPLPLQGAGNRLLPSGRVNPDRASLLRANPPGRHRTGNRQHRCRDGDSGKLRVVDRRVVDARRSRSGSAPRSPSPTASAAAARRTTARAPPAGRYAGRVPLPVFRAGPPPEMGLQ
jgi:hypothetical protein